MSKLTKYQSMHPTLFPTRIGRSVGCFLFVESYKTQKRTLAPQSIYIHTYIHILRHARYKYENRHRHICVRSHWPESTGSRSITEVKQG
jgi:hypothetical protein